MTKVYSKKAASTWPSSTQSIVVGCAFSIFLIALIPSLLGLHGFDYTIIYMFNTLSRKSAILDNALAASTKDMFSNLVMMSLCWFVWFDTYENKRAGIMVGVIMSYAAGLISRLLQLSLPTHLRPLHDPKLGFRIPIGIDPNLLNHWSSFPSDHAAVFFGLVTMLFFASQKIGWISLILAIVFSCVRIYLGYHYPTDIIAGAMLGVVIVGMSQHLRLSRLASRLLETERTYRRWFYAVSFYFCFGIASLFNDYRDVAANLAHAAKVHLHQ